MTDSMRQRLIDAGDSLVVVAFKKTDGRTRRMVGKIEALTDTHVRVRKDEKVYRNIPLSCIRFVSLPLQSTASGGNVPSVGHSVGQRDE